MDFLKTVFASTLSTTVLVALVLWLFRQLIQNRLKAAVEHEFNTKLSALQSELRNSEEMFKAELRAKEVEIQALQNSALSAMTGRQMAVDKRRLEAIDQLWSAVNDLSRSRGIATTISVFKFSEVSKRIETEPKLREFFKAFGEVNLPETLKEDGWRARPHVSRLAWAYFSAFRSIIAVSTAKLYLLQKGLGGDFPISVANMVKAALPHRSEHIDKHGEAALPWLLDELETSLLEEFSRISSGKATDQESVKRAAEILAAVADVQQQAATTAAAK